MFPQVNRGLLFKAKIWWHHSVDIKSSKACVSSAGKPCFVRHASNCLQLTLTKVCLDGKQVDAALPAPRKLHDGWMSDTSSKPATTCPCKTQWSDRRSLYSWQWHGIVAVGLRVIHWSQRLLWRRSWKFWWGFSLTFEEGMWKGTRTCFNRRTLFPIHLDTRKENNGSAVNWSWMPMAPLGHVMFRNLHAAFKIWRTLLRLGSSRLWLRRISP